MTQKNLPPAGEIDWSKPRLLAKGIRKDYETRQVLRGVDLEVYPGQIVALIGSSGSGKSTLLNILGILDEADSGNYILDKLPIKNLNETIASKYRNQFLGFVFQSFNLINYKSALDNVAMPLYYQGIKRKERNEIAMNFLEKVGLKAMRRLEKYRHTFELGDVTVDIDTWPKIPVYMEVEGPSVDSLKTQYRNHELF